MKCTTMAHIPPRPIQLTFDPRNLHTTIKVYARCLRPDIEYKTLSVTLGTSSRELVGMLLRKVRMRHRDPNLFYLRMEVRVRSAGLRTALALDDHARPAALQLCHPKGYSKFSLQMRRGGLVKVHDSALMASSQYKSLLISERTTADELLAILLNCYNSRESVDRFTLYEVSASQEYQRKLHPDDLPLRVQQAWPPDSRCYFLVRRNPDLRDLAPNVLWSSPYDTPKEHPYLSTLDDTLQSFSSLTLVEERSPTREDQFDVHHKLENKAEMARNRSIDSILEERCEKWGNYVNIRNTDAKSLVKSQSCQCEKGNFCDCSTSDNNNEGDCPPPSMVTSKSCHQIGCYSPVYKYPSISYWSPVNKSGPKSLDATSFSSLEASDVVTSTPNQSPVATSSPSTCRIVHKTPEHKLRGGDTPVAAPRTKSLTPSSPEYENYLYI